MTWHGFCCWDIIWYEFRLACPKTDKNRAPSKLTRYLVSAHGFKIKSLAICPEENSARVHVCQTILTIAPSRQLQRSVCGTFFVSKKQVAALQHCGALTVFGASEHLDVHVSHPSIQRSTFNATANAQQSDRRATARQPHMEHWGPLVE